MKVGEVEERNKIKEWEAPLQRCFPRTRGGLVQNINRALLDTFQYNPPFPYCQEEMSLIGAQC